MILETTEEKYVWTFSEVISVVKVFVEFEPLVSWVLYFKLSPRNFTLDILHNIDLLFLEQPKLTLTHINTVTDICKGNQRSINENLANSFCDKLEITDLSADEKHHCFEI
jgi:hypothetical protein